MLNHYLAHWPSTNRSLMRPTLAEFVEELASMGLPEDGAWPDCYHVRQFSSGPDQVSNVNTHTRAALDEYLNEAQTDADNKRSYSGEL